MVDFSKGKDLVSLVFNELLSSKAGDRLFEKIRALRQQRLQRFFEISSDSLRDLSFREKLFSQIEQDERLQEFILKCSKRISEEMNESKFNAYQNAFLNGMAKQTIEINLALKFLQILDRVDVVELSVLGFLAPIQPTDFTKTRDIMVALAKGSDVDRSLILSAVDTLANLDLIRVGHVKISADAMLQRDEHDYQLTSLGRKFIAFVLEPRDK